MSSPAQDGRPALIGVVLVPEGFDALGPIGGLPPLLRHALAFQAAGARSVVVLGAQTELPKAGRLTTAVVRALPEHARALVVRADVSPHRALPTRLAAMTDALVFAGEREAALFACDARHTQEVVDALAGARLPEGARNEPLAGTGHFAEFVVPAANLEQRRNAHERHLRSLRKPTGGVFEQLYMRPLSLQMTRVLCRSSITPNAMSAVTLAIALLAGALIALPDPRMSVAGGLLHIWMRVVDCIDGELARLKYQASRSGEWFDTIGDGIGMAAFLAGVTVHAARSDANLLVIGTTGTLAWMLVQALQVTGALYAGASGTFHKVEWGHRKKERNLLERFVGAIEMALRIDAISTYYGLAVAFGLHAVLLHAHLAIALPACLYFGAQVLRLRALARAHANEAR